MWGGIKNGFGKGCKKFVKNFTKSADAFTPELNAGGFAEILQS